MTCNSQSDVILQKYYLSRRKVKNTSQQDLSLMAKLAYALHFFRDLYLKPLRELSQSLMLLDPKMWDPIDIAISIFFFEETCGNKHGLNECMIDRSMLYYGNFLMY